MQRLSSSMCTLLLATQVIACSGGSDRPPDTVTAPLTCSDEAGGAIACNFSCLYKSSDAPAAGSATYTLSGKVKDFFNDDPIKDATVNVWLDGDTSHAPDGTSVATGTDGLFTIGMTGVRGNVRAAFKVSNSSADYIDTFHYNVFVAAEGSMSADRIGVRDLTVQIILGLFNLTGDPSAGHITGRFSDCDEKHVANGILRLYAAPHTCGNAGTELPVIIGYFDGAEFPDPKQHALNKDGLFLAANVKAPEAVAEIWGSMADGQNAELLGCSSLKVAPGSISILSLEPYPDQL